MKKLKLFLLLLGISSLIACFTNKRTDSQENKTNQVDTKKSVANFLNIVSFDDKKYLGEFVFQQDKKWGVLNYKGEKSLDLLETKRDEWAIFLNHQSSGLKIHIDLREKKVYRIPADEKPKEHIYNVMSPADHSVNGLDASRVIFGSKTETPPVISSQDGSNGLHGYLGYNISNQQELTKYNAGVGFYTSVWPLVSKPLHSFQIGLPSIWVTPDNSDNNITPLCPVGTVARDRWDERGPTYRDVFQTMEGGVGYWVGVHFKNVAPKFSINGVSQCYDYQIASPGWSFFGSNDPLPDNQLGIAQLSNRLLIPPDALSFKDNSNGKVVGYTWMALPLSESTYEGEFVKKEGKNWVELSKNGEVKYNFVERNRDQWSIYLYDKSRKIEIVLNLWEKKIYSTPVDGSPAVHLYNVMYPADRSIEGQVADRVVFASTKTSAPTSHPPTGGNSWTLFMNTQNFKGPLAFYIPEAWSRIASVFDEPYNIGKGLDTKLASAGSGNASMEINTVPYMKGTDKNGTEYTKIPPLYFPVDDQKRSILVRDLKLYSKDALFNSIEQWRKGGKAVSGSFVDKGVRPKLRAHDASYKHQNKKINGLNDVVQSTIFPTENAWGIQWDISEVSPPGQFPQYFRNDGNEYIPVSRKDVPDETGLLNKAFGSDKKGQPYAASATSAWKVPGGQNTTYTANLKDGSVVTYKWYRFIDQPSFQQFNFSNEKKEEIQRFVEKVHKDWTIDREYIEPPSSGTLISLDDALIVTPPAGLESGYVPIVIRQEYRE